MSNLSVTIAAWTGAIGVALTWLTKLVSFLLRRRKRLDVQLINGPALIVANRGAVPIDFRPPMWHGQWHTWGQREGSRYIDDVDGGYFRLEPGAERTFHCAPDRDSAGGFTLKGETARKMVESADPFNILSPGGKLLCRVPCEKIRELLRRRISKVG